MAQNNVIAGAALARGIRNEFANTWQRRYQGLQERLSRSMELAIKSDKIEELWGYFETAPYPQRRPFGEEVPSKPFRARNFTTENFSWDMSVTWRKSDRLFDQLKSLDRQARQGGENFATLPERVFFQMLLATIDPLLLPSIPNAPDGVPIYSALDGDGANRFGVAGGNRETGVDFTTGEGVRTGIINGFERIGQFLDPEGQPAFDPGIIDEGMTIYYPISRSKEFREAVMQGVTQQKITGTAGADVSVSAAVSNVIGDSGMMIRLVGTSRITVDQAFMFLDGFEPKPIFEHVALPLEETVQVEENSDIARKTKQEGVFWNSFRGYGKNLPLGTVRLS